jgi:hypothetical protein
MRRPIRELLGPAAGRWWLLPLGAALFAIGYALANRYQLTHGVF